MLNLISTMLVLTAALAYINARFIKLPSAIGILLTALISALVAKGLVRLGMVDLQIPLQALTAIDFRKTLLDVMLAPLLFAGALHVDWASLRAQKTPVFILATLGTVIAAACVAFALRLAGGWVGYDIPWLWATAFGVLIAPTDPITVGAILRKAGVPTDLQTTITGESLFNDGVAVVLFLLVLATLGTGEVPDPATIARLLAAEVLGGLVFGFALGWGAVRLLRPLNNYQVEILFTVALVFGGYMAAQYLHVSGVLAMVIAGLMMGETSRSETLSALTQQRLDDFWELIDEFLNAALFVLLGVEVLVLDLSVTALLLGAAMIPFVLLSRGISVVAPLLPLHSRLGWPPGGFRILTWAGVRGGISIALALALPPHPMRTLLLTVAYVVVCFSVVGQGLTMEPIARRLFKRPATG